MPTFSNLGKNWYSDIVPENIELHSPLSIQIQATSPMSRKLIYSIVEGNELEEFAVDFNTGNAKYYISSTSLHPNTYSHSYDKINSCEKIFRIKRGVLGWDSHSHSFVEC